MSKLIAFLYHNFLSKRKGRDLSSISNFSTSSKKQEQESLFLKRKFSKNYLALFSVKETPLLQNNMLKKYMNLYQNPPRIHYSICYLIIIVGTLTGCNSETESFEISGLNFYPLTIGTYVTHQVTETIYGVNKEPQATEYQIKERVSGILQEAQGNIPTIYEMRRFRRSTTNDPWSLEAIWTIRGDNQRIIRVESGTAFVKLAFPFLEDKTWDGNAYNNLGRQHYKMTDLQKTFVASSGKDEELVFQNTCTILEAQDSSAVTKNYSQSIYAENVGLVYTLSENYAYCQTANCFGQALIESGEKIEQRVIDFGIE